MNPHDARNRIAVTLAIASAFAVGALLAWHVKPTVVEAQPDHRALYEYRVLQSRDLYTEAAAPTKEQLQEKLNRLSGEGYELLNPVAQYFEDKGFGVVTGAFPDRAKYPDRRAVLLLRRERR